MAAVFPGAVRSFTTKVNNIDIVDAAHPNVLQEEVVAIESVFGVNPQISPAPVAAGWVSTGNSWETVSARLNNIEKGIVADSHTQYVNRSGGSVITTSAADVKGLVVKGSSGQSANLQEWQTSDGTVVAYVTPTGAFVGNTSTVEQDNLYVLSMVFA